VLSFPIPLRIPFAARPELLAPVLRITRPAIANERQLQRNATVLNGSN
jgi:hypothetical protein